jgi:hypothetical protein
MVLDTVPRPRPVDDHSPAVEVSELSGGGEGAEDRAEAVRNRIMSESARNIQEFAKEITGDLERLRFESLGNRDSENFPKRMTRNNRRSAARLKVLTDDQGMVKLNEEDGHAVLGITQGWSLQACNTASSFFFRALFESSKRPFLLKGQGNRHENMKLVSLFTHIVDKMLMDGNLREEMRRISDLIPRQGTAVLRYQMARKSEFLRDGNGSWSERISRLRPSFQAWPLNDVIVTNYQRPSAQDQEGVFWLTPGATIPMLERDEAVFGIRREGNNATFIQAGKFTNLDEARKKFGGGGAPESGGGNDQDARSRAEKASSFDQFTLVEYEGAVSLSKYVESGVLTPEVAQFFGMDVGFYPDPEDRVQMDTWKSRLSRISHYNISYLIDDDAAQEQTGNPSVMVQFEPDRHKRPRNSLFAFRYLREGMKFLGQSVVDVGRKLEDAADMIMNAQTWGSFKNAHPSHLFTTRVLKKKSVDEIARLLHQPDALVQIDGAQALRVSDVYQTVFVQLDPDAAGKIASLKNEFEFTTRVSAEAKGAPTRRSTDTLGELQINEQKSQIQLSDLVMASGDELARLVSLIIQDLMFFMSEEEFSDFAIQMAGLDAVDLEKLLPSTLSIEDELNVFHPITAAQDKTSLAVLLLRLFQLTGVEGFPDPKRFIKIILELQDFPFGEELVEDPKASMDPIDEHAMMAQGHWVNPNPGENFAEHLQRHEQLLRLIQESGGRIPGYDEEESRNIASLLGHHVNETLELMMNVMAAAGLSQPAPQNGGSRGLLAGQGGPAGGGGGQMNAGVNTQEAGPMEQNTSPADARTLTNNVGRG